MAPICRDRTGMKHGSGAQGAGGCWQLTEVLVEGGGGQLIQTNLSKTTSPNHMREGGCHFQSGLKLQKPAGTQVTAH